MTRDDTSVATSIEEILKDEDRRRAEEVRLAYQRKLAEERAAAAERVRLETAARKQTEADRMAEARRVEELQQERERQQTARMVELERTRIEAELRAKVAVMNTEQQHELERLAYVRDQRVSTLEGQRLVLAALLATLALGALGLYATVLAPHTARQTAAIALLEQAKLQSLEESKRERGTLEQRVRDLEVQNGRLGTELQQTKDQLHARPPDRVPGPRTPGTRHPPVTDQKRTTKCINPNDPLCDDLGGR